jgi:hypothetical protein
VCETYTSSTRRDRGSDVHLFMHDYTLFWSSAENVSNANLSDIHDVHARHR